MDSHEDDLNSAKIDDDFEEKIDKHITDLLLLTKRASGQAACGCGEKTCCPHDHVGIGRDENFNCPYMSMGFNNTPTEPGGSCPYAPRPQTASAVPQRLCCPYDHPCFPREDMTCPFTPRPHTHHCFSRESEMCPFATRPQPQFCFPQNTMTCPYARIPQEYSYFPQDQIMASPHQARYCSMEPSDDPEMTMCPLGKESHNCLKMYASFAVLVAILLAALIGIYEYLSSE